MCCVPSLRSPRPVLAFRYGGRQWAQLLRRLFPEGGVWGVARPGTEVLGLPATLGGERTAWLVAGEWRRLRRMTNGGGNGGDWQLDLLEGKSRERKKLWRGKERLEVGVVVGGWVAAWPRPAAVKPRVAARSRAPLAGWQIG